MGQYANQPDFITHDIKAVTPIAVDYITELEAGLPESDIVILK